MSSEDTIASRSRRIAVIALVVYGCVLAVANESFTVFEDEAMGVAAAATNSLGFTLGTFATGAGTAEHPPLYDLFLHVWIKVTGGARGLLRVPSVVFYCLALWLVAATAQRLWGARLTAVGVAIAWPTGYFLGVPAHWSSLAMLCIAGVTWAYVWWRDTEQPRALVAFSLFAIALIYTNYLGWAILGGLGIHFLLSRPDRRLLKHGTAAGFAIVLSFLPILRAFEHELHRGAHVKQSLMHKLASAAYHGYSLAVSEAVAPWYWPAAFAAVGLLALLYVAARNRQTLWILGLLALVFVPSALIGILNGRRLAMYAPWFLLLLTGAIASGQSRKLRKVAVVAVIVIFATGWTGVATKRWLGTYRYVEPWDQIASLTGDLSGPGDLVICDHPSFYFYSFYALDWSDWKGLLGGEPFEQGGRSYTRLATWEKAVASQKRIVYLRTVVMAYDLDAQARLDEFLAQNYRLVREEKYLKDEQSALKNRFVLNQPPWRIELRVYERKDGNGS